MGFVPRFVAGRLFELLRLKSRLELRVTFGAIFTDVFKLSAFLKRSELGMIPLLVMLE